MGVIGAPAMSEATAPDGDGQRGSAASIDLRKAPPYEGVTAGADSPTCETVLLEIRRSGSVGVRELSRHTAAILKAVEGMDEPLLITRNGRVIAALVATSLREVLAAFERRDVPGSAVADALSELATGKTRRAGDTNTR